MSLMISIDCLRSNNNHAALSVYCNFNSTNKTHTLMTKSTSHIHQDHSEILESQIFYSIQHCQYKQLALYRRNNYNLNIISKDGRNGLFYALDISSPIKRRRMLKYCLEYGMSPLQREKTYGFTLLNEVIARQQIDSFEFLLDEISGDIDWRAFDNQGRTILHQAVETNNPIILEPLLAITNRYHVSIDIPDKNGLTPYLLSKKLHFEQMSELLVKKGHASRLKSDVQTHRTANDWEMIGHRETNVLLRRKFRQEINDALRNGQLPKAHQLKKLTQPVSSFSFYDKYRRKSYNTSKSSLSINELIDQLSEGDTPEMYFNSQHHLPTLNATSTSKQRTNPSFRSVIDLFQIAS